MRSRVGCGGLFRQHKGEDCMAARKAMPGVIRKICLWCQGGSSKLVRECAHVPCPLHPSRMIEDADDTALQDCVAAFCLACAGSSEAVSDCSADRPIGGQSPCPAHPFRVPAPAPLVQQIPLLPGLGEACPQYGQFSDADKTAVPEAVRHDAAGISPAKPPSRHDALATMYAGRAPEALDI